MCALVWSALGSSYSVRTLVAAVTWGLVSHTGNLRMGVDQDVDGN